MARYKGPKSKISRRYREPIFGDTKALEKKPHPPGQHGRGRKRKPSEYAVQLSEKQKAKYIYGVLEKQFHNLFNKASRKSGITGENLLQLLESRLDNVVYRLGISPTRRAARQLVSHKHFLVNNKCVNIPSFQLRADDVINVREKSKKMDLFQDSLRKIQGDNPMPWLEIDKAQLKGKFISVPDRDEITEPLNEQLIVELYSK